MPCTTPPAAATARSVATTSGTRHSPGQHRRHPGRERRERLGGDPPDGGLGRDALLRAEPGGARGAEGGTGLRGRQRSGGPFARRHGPQRLRQRGGEAAGQARARRRPGRARGRGGARSRARARSRPARAAPRPRRARRGRVSCRSTVRRSGSNPHAPGAPATSLPSTRTPGRPGQLRPGARHGAERRRERRLGGQRRELGVAGRAQPHGALDHRGGEPAPRRGGPGAAASPRRAARARARRRPRPRRPGGRGGTAGARPRSRRPRARRRGRARRRRAARRRAPRRGRWARRRSRRARPGAAVSAASRLAGVTPWATPAIGSSSGASQCGSSPATTSPATVAACTSRWTTTWRPRAACRARQAAMSAWRRSASAHVRAAPHASAAPSRGSRSAGRPNCAGAGRI